MAEAFRGLDEERDALRALSEARGAATEFLRHYRRYAQVAAKRKATGPRQTQSRYEQLGRDLTAAEEAYTAADAELQAAHARARGPRAGADQAGSPARGTEAGPRDA